MKTTKFNKYLMAIILLCSSLIVMAVDDCICFTSALKKVPVESLTLNHDEMIIRSNDQSSQTISLEAIVGPTNAYNQKVTWTSSDSNIEVDSTGNIIIPKKYKSPTEKIDGKDTPIPFTITATLVDDVTGETLTFTAKCSICAVQNLPITQAITIDANDLCADPGETINIYTDCGLVAYKELKNGQPNGIITGPNLGFSSNKTYATVSDAGVVTIAANAPASETVTIDIHDNSAASHSLGSITLQITGGAPTSIKLNQATATIYVRKGQRYVQLIPTVTPKCASHDVTWTTADGTIATVDNTGLVTAILLDNDTSVVITATSTENPNISAECIVNICRKRPYTVAPDTWVEFSPGNLQYNAMAGTHETADGAGITDGTWRFAPNQWDVIGAPNANIAENYDGWVDLYGWGTSGWYSGKDTYWHPWDTEGLKYQYAILCVNGTFQSTQPYYDWGIYNAIDELMGDETVTHAPGSWRTLTRPEWEYLIGVVLDGNGGSEEATTHRANALKLHTMGTVNGIPGLLLLPDDWEWDYVPAGYPDAKRWDAAVRNYTTYQLTVAEWKYLEAEGAMFLPATGKRQGQGDKVAGSVTPVEVGVNGYYWSSSDFCKNHANVMNFTSSFIGVQENHQDVCDRCNGYAVRLVRDIDL